MKIQSARRWVAAAFVAAGVIGTLGAGAEGNSSQDRPWKGTAVGDVTILSAVEFEVDYTGNATHMGKFTRHEHITLNPADLTVSGTIDYVAADGSVLNTSITGQFTPPGSVAGTYTITGGDGRFAGATGTAVFSGTTDFVTANISFDGTINY